MIEPQFKPRIFYSKPNTVSLYHNCLLNQESKKQRGKYIIQRDKPCPEVPRIIIYHHILSPRLSLFLSNFLPLGQNADLLICHILGISAPGNSPSSWLLCSTPAMQMQAESQDQSPSSVLRKLWGRLELLSLHISHTVTCISSSNIRLQQDLEKNFLLGTDLTGAFWELRGKRMITKSGWFQDIPRKSL